MQHYPKNACTSEAKNGWNITYFLDHSNGENNEDLRFIPNVLNGTSLGVVVQLAQWELPGIVKSKALGKPVILTEFNSVSCGGEPGRSDTVDYRSQLFFPPVTDEHIHFTVRGCHVDNRLYFVSHRLQLYFRLPPHPRSRNRLQRLRSCFKW